MRRDYFARPALRRLTAEQLLDSIRVATTGQLVPAERCFLDNRSTALARALGRPASRNEISTARPDDVAVVQSLELLNGRELHEMIYSNALFTEAGRQAGSAPRWSIGSIARCSAGRPRSPRRTPAARICKPSESPAEGLKDMLWALVCSPEFQYIK